MPRCSVLEQVEEGDPRENRLTPVPLENVHFIAVAVFFPLILFINLPPCIVQA